MHANLHFFSKKFIHMCFVLPQTSKSFILLSHRIVCIWARDVCTNNTGQRIHKHDPNLERGERGRYGGYMRNSVAFSICKFSSWDQMERFRYPESSVLQNTYIIWLVIIFVLLRSCKFLFFQHLVF
jgi:hypothetical protein